jgi:hypothetical protein
VKIHYTFDKDSQVNCLARWPHILQIRSIPLDESSSIGVMDLKTCLQAITQCSPELAGDSERDYTVYAYDYSEPDTPLVGQGLLCWALNQNYDSASQQLVTGRVTKNMLAIFGNGVAETLEVKLRLTAVPKAARATATPAAHTPVPVNMPTQYPPRLPQSNSNLSESTEWNNFIQSNPNMGRPGNVSMSSPVPAPVRPFNSGYDARNEVMGQGFQSGPMNASSRPGSRAGSLGPVSQGNGAAMVPVPPAQPMAGAQSQVQDMNGAAITRPAQPRSRPTSRASSRAPTGRPRGRPRKKPAPVEGNTSGYEDGTDADESQPTKKRAKTTKVERSFSGTFGSAPESLRVAASTSGSLRSFRPVSMGGEAVAGSHLQEIPRAPTPVPDRMPGLPQSQPAQRSQLRRQSTSGLAEQNSSFTNSYLDVNRSMSNGNDARSPTDSLAPSPSQYSEGPSPADIGSSPPVPRSVMYSANSSPAPPSSPILPPMRVTQVDSGFMSGGLEDNRMDEDEANKPAGAPLPAPTVVKPKPKRSRTKKPQAPKADKTAEKNESLVMHAETPGPPELLPQTSIYNPPVRQPPPPNARKQSENPPTPVMPEPTNHTPLTMAPSEEPTPLPHASLEQRMTMSPDVNQSQDDFDELEQVLLRGLNGQENHFFDSLSTSHIFGAAEGIHMHNGDVRATIEQANAPMDPPPAPRASEESTAEPELPPMVPASDPVYPHSAIMGSEPAHPQTDIAGPEGKFNKNYIKKQAIKQRLDEAIAAGQMPPFCTNCGAIQTPTWRKIFKQEFQGVPSFHEFSEKPGHVTAINVLTRNDEGEITSYEMVKKALSGTEDKSSWNEVLLCNPCGLWFSKWKAPRPADKWEKDQQRLNQTRKRREPGEKGARASKPKKSRTKSDSQANTASEACLMTDPLGLDTTDSPRDELPNPFNGNAPTKNGIAGNSENFQGPGSTHSRASVRSGGSGRTPGSPIALDEDLGATRRLLFPSPRKDGEHKILGEVAVNIVHTAPEFREHKTSEMEKENTGLDSRDHDDLADLFGTPARPSTPPPKSGGSGPFKTPTRPTPSHRPITRSVTKSIRSVRSIKSPAHVHAALQRTPTAAPNPSAMIRRSPRVAGLPSHMLDESHHHHPDSPFTRSINQLLSEANDFMTSDLDLGHLPHIDPSEHLAAPEPGHWDFSNLLSTDGVMPSSPPTMRHHGLGGHVSFAAHLTYEGDADIWKHLDAVDQSGDGSNVNHHK